MPREVSCEGPITREMSELTSCEEHAEGGELQGADHKGNVRNSQTVKSMPREVSCEGPITREMSELTSCEEHAEGGEL
jgi:hypothetical protein